MSKLSSKNLKEAYRCLLLDGMDPEFRRKYIEARLPIENYQLTELSTNDAKKEGIKLGKELGIELGIKVSLLMAASNMLLKYSNEQAVQLTGLSLAEVASLRTLSRSDAAASPARPCRRSNHARACPGAQRDPDSLSIEAISGLSQAYSSTFFRTGRIPTAGGLLGGFVRYYTTPISSLSPEQPIAPHSVAPDERTPTAAPKPRPAPEGRANGAIRFPARLSRREARRRARPPVRRAT